MGAGLLGCSTHPLPQDVARVSVVDIVRRIRCEAKEGLEDALRRAAAQGAKRRAHVERIRDLSKIGYEFNFVMSENNNAGASGLTFERAASHPGDGFKLVLVADLNSDNSENARQNTRTFSVVDDLKELQKARCGRVETTRRNPVYPITGSIGISEIVRTYIELETMTELTTVNAEKGQEMIAFSDRLEFTTTFDAAASAELQFETAVGSWRLTNASLSGSAFRQDVHKVTVSLARDGGAEPDLPEIARFGRSVRRSPAKPGQLPNFPIQAIRDKGLQTFLAQRASVARNRILFELERRRHTDENKDVAERVLGVPVP
jgi:hypothetical protein